MTYVSKRKAIHIRVSNDEPESLIEAVGRLPRWTRRQINGLGTQTACTIQGEAIQGLADSLASRTLVDDDVFDPRAQTGRYWEHHERQGSDDRITVSRNEDVTRVVLDDRRQLVRCRRRIRRRQLGNQARHGINQLLRRTISDGHDDCHTTTLPHATPDAKCVLNPGFRP